MANAAELLEQLGFGEYEARAYIALLERNPLNGYELAKTSGIPRANIYAVLQRLEARNAVIRVDTDASVRYAPVPPAELIPQLENRYQNILDDAQRSLLAISSPVETNLTRNIIGRTAMLDQARMMIESAHDDVFVAACYPELEVLAESLNQAEQHNVHLMTICLEGCSGACGMCKSTVYRYHILPTQPTRWLIVIQDSREMILGEINQGAATALRTPQLCFVLMAKQFIRSSVAWAAVLLNSDQHLDQTLPSETQRILGEIGPDGSWLTYMRQLLHKSKN